MSRLRLERAAWRDVEPSSWERRPMLAAARAARVSPSTELRVSHAEVAVFPRSTEMKSSETSGDEGRIDDRRAAWLRAFKAVRDETERRAAPLSPEDQVHPVDAGREPDQVASRAHDLVLRDSSCCGRTCPATGRSTSASRSCSTPTTSPPARGTRGRSAGCITRPGRKRSRRLPRPCRRAMAALIERRGDAALDGILRDPRDRAAPRAAASGADPHRHPARLRAEPDRAGLRRGLDMPAAAADGARPACVDLDGGVHADRPRRARASRSTTRGRGTACCCRPCALRARLVTNGEWLAFIAGRRLRRAGALALRRLGRGAGGRLGRAGLLAATVDGAWLQMTLGGLRRSIPPRRSAT